LTLLFQSYSFFKKSQIALAIFRVIFLVKIKDETAVNKLALAFDFSFFFCFLFLYFLFVQVLDYLVEVKLFILLLNNFS